MAERRRYNFEDLGPTDEEIEAEVASILRRPADDPDRLFIESSIEQCRVIFLYAKHLAPEDGMECQPRNCEECGEPFTPPLHDADALYCSKECLHKCIRRGALNALKLEREHNAAERESQPT
jgi:hypothetical protein